MKHLIMSLVAMASFSLTALAQPKFTPTADTSNNSETRYIYTQSMPNNSGNLSFQYVATKLSGTVSGSVKLESTIDGVNYVAESDTLSLANVAVNTKMWDITNKKRYKWRFNVTTSGTMSFTNKGYYTER